MKLNVYLNAYGERSYVGILREEERRVFFEYSPDFLRNGVELSPFMLPRKSGVFEDAERTFDGLFGLFNDSLPDGWGVLLIDRQLRRLGLSWKEITPLRRLSLIGANPMGALEYEPTDKEEQVHTGNIELDSLSGKISEVLSGSGSSMLDELRSLNGSSGGARPKALVWVSADFSHIVHGSISSPGSGYTQWIIKFPESSATPDAGLDEYRYSIAAKDSGIDIPPTWLFPSKKCGGYFGVRRFDRVPKGKVHVHTACGLLHASHRLPSLDYENLLKLTKILTKERTQTMEMVKRMVFNVLLCNKDDHSKNFSYLMDEAGKWKLSPAYDLTRSEGINGEQTSMVNGKGKGITTADLIAAAATAGIEASFVKACVERTLGAAAKHGIEPQINN